MGKKTKKKQALEAVKPPKILIETYKLTEQQQQVLNLCAKGLANIAIAKLLNIELSSVRFHFARLYNKFNIPTDDTGISPRVILASKWLKLTGTLNKNYKSALDKESLQ